MPQLPPSFNKASHATKTLFFLATLYVPVEGEKAERFPGRQPIS